MRRLGVANQYVFEEVEITIDGRKRHAFVRARNVESGFEDVLDGPVARPEVADLAAVILPLAPWRSVA